MKIRIDRRALRAVSRFAATNDIRHYLNGVHVDAVPNGTVLVTTDGRVLGAHHYPAQNEIESATTLILPGTIVHAFSKFGKIYADIPLDLEKIGSEWSIYDPAAQQRTSFTPVDGRFPDWRRIMPTKVSGEAAVYSPDLMARFSDAGRDFHGKTAECKVTYGQNGFGSALVNIVDTAFVGVIMPLKVSAATLPSWFHTHQVQKEQATA